jgi:transposase, IS5 family
MAHIGADRDFKLMHSVVVTASNVADITQPAELLHRHETQVHADTGYTTVEMRAELVRLGQTIDRQIAGNRGAIRAMASVRTFVEHPFDVRKNFFRHRKVG